MNIQACTSSSRLVTENLPLDEYGGVDWRKLQQMQLRRYSLADLKAELARRNEDLDS